MLTFDCREIIIKRDGCRCTKCGRTSTIAHFDNKSRKTIHIWITEGKTIRAENIGIDIDLDFPEIKVADKYYTLHVHHTLYILEKLPWEYKPEELITLCNWCHWEFHESNIVPVFRTNDDHSLEKLAYVPCSRCHGAGWFPQYKHVDNGICFRCLGARYEQMIRAKPSD